MFKKIFVFVFLFLNTLFASDNSDRFLVHILDYLAQDYGVAVQQGKIINQYEYDEQVEFIKAAQEANNKLSFSKKTRSKLDILENFILSKSDPQKVSALAREIQQEVIQLSGLSVAPTKWPNLHQGEKIFRTSCIQCHGTRGGGDGPMAKGLNPQPTNFLDQDYMKSVSPFKAFNTIRLGIPGTTMTPFSQLSDKDAWNVAFYVISLRHQGEFHHSQPSMDLEKVAISSDEELLKDSVSLIRLYSKEDFSDHYIHLAKENLQKALDSYRKEDFVNAKKYALVAYLDGIEPIEPRLKASDRHIVPLLEHQLALVRNSIESKKTIEEINAHIQVAYEALDKARMLLEKKAPSAWFTFLISSGIILREGFEAILIIIALLGVIRASGVKQAALWVHGGWIFALLCGVAAWFFSGWLMMMSGAGRELLEAVVSLLAVVILLYLGFWLHGKTEIHKWTLFIRTQIEKALSKSHLLTLGAISFMAVFREAFETVLFLRALLLEGGSKTAMLSGTLGSLGMVFILAFLLLKFSIRIPIQTLFKVSSIIMLSLAVILTGKGFHALQETGLLSITVLPVHIRFDMIGLYPTLETLVAQGFVVLLSIVLWKWVHTK